MLLWAIRGKIEKLTECLSRGRITAGQRLRLGPQTLRFAQVPQTGRADSQARVDAFRPASYYSHPQNQERTTVPKSIRITLAAFGGLSVAAGLVALAITLTLTGAPAFYQAAVERDAAVLEEDSDQCLQQAAALASNLQSPGEWQAIFSADQINGWLAVDLCGNYGEALPPEITNPRIDFHSGAATLACTYRHAGHETVMSIAFDLYLSEPNVVAPVCVASAPGCFPCRWPTCCGRSRKRGTVSGCWCSGGRSPAIRWRSFISRTAPTTIANCSSKRSNCAKAKSMSPAARCRPRRPNWLAASGTRLSTLIRPTTRRTPKSPPTKTTMPNRPTKKTAPASPATTTSAARHGHRRPGSRCQTRQSAAQRGSSRVGGEEEPPALIAPRFRTSEPPGRAAGCPPVARRFLPPRSAANETAANGNGRRRTARPFLARPTAAPRT